MNNTCEAVSEVFREACLEAWNTLMFSKDEAYSSLRRPFAEVSWLSVSGRFEGVRRRILFDVFSILNEELPEGFTEEEIHSIMCDVGFTIECLPPGGEMPFAAYISIGKDTARILGLDVECACFLSLGDTKASSEFDDANGGQLSVFDPKATSHTIDAFRHSEALARRWN